MTHLLPDHIAQLAASAIAPSIIKLRGYQSITPGAVQAVRELTAGAFSAALLKVVLHQGALAIPLYRLGDEKAHTYVLRPELPRSHDNGKPVKYEYPRGVSNVFDVLPCYRDALADPSIPLWLTEGAKKADALASAYAEQIVPVNLNGVFGWRGRNEKGGKTALPDMELIAWEGRQIVIAPDGDVKENTTCCMPYNASGGCWWHDMVFRRYRCSTFPNSAARPSSASMITLLRVLPQATWTRTWLNLVRLLVGHVCRSLSIPKQATS